MEGEVVASVRYGYGPHDYAGTAEVAEYLGISKQSVNNWRARYEDWPAPVALLAMGPIYRLCDIRDWHRQHKETENDTAGA